MIAGGVESMTRAPFAMRKSAARRSTARRRAMFDTTLGWRFENPRMAERFPLQSMGETAENVAEKWKIGRDEQDAFALESQRKAGAALAARRVRRGDRAGARARRRRGEPVSFAKDESPAPRRDAGGAREAARRVPQGGHRDRGQQLAAERRRERGRSSRAKRRCARRELEPLARVVAFATAGVEPNLMGEGPIPAGKKALARAGWRVGDLDLVELNEAFAAQSIACVRGLELDPARVNVNGGAIALGHPIGSSGCRVLGTLVHAMAARTRSAGWRRCASAWGRGSRCSSNGSGPDRSRRPYWHHIS